MRFNFRHILFAVPVFALALGFLCYRASHQRHTVRQLMNHDHVAIQFSDGEYFGSVAAVEDSKHLFHAVNVVYLDLPRDEANELIPILRQLPALNRVILRHQTDDYDAFRAQQSETWKSFEKLGKEIGEAFPKVEILKCWAAVEVEDFG